MLLLHTCMKSNVKMPFLDTIHVNVVGFVLSEPEQWGEIRLCQNISSVHQVLKRQQHNPTATDCIININQTTKDKEKITS